MNAYELSCFITSYILVILLDILIVAVQLKLIFVVAAILFTPALTHDEIRATWWGKICHQLTNICLLIALIWVGVWFFAWFHSIELTLSL
jgi:hypothetical protein